MASDNFVYLFNICHVPRPLHERNTRLDLFRIVTAFLGYCRYPWHAKKRMNKRVQHDVSIINNTA
jgi:hypothetical protein